MTSFFFNCFILKTIKTWEVNIQLSTTSVKNRVFTDIANVNESVACFNRRSTLVRYLKLISASSSRLFTKFLSSLISLLARLSASLQNLQKLSTKKKEEFSWSTKCRFRFSLRFYSQLVDGLHMIGLLILHLTEFIFQFGNHCLLCSTLFRKHLYDLDVAYVLLR